MAFLKASRKVMKSIFYGAPEGTFRFRYLSEKKLKQENENRNQKKKKKKKKRKTRKKEKNCLNNLLYHLNSTLCRLNDIYDRMESKAIKAEWKVKYENRKEIDTTNMSFKQVII